jgi:hypothetical protein
VDGFHLSQSYVTKKSRSSVVNESSIVSSNILRNTASRSFNGKAEVLGLLDGPPAVIVGDRAREVLLPRAYGRRAVTLGGSETEAGALSPRGSSSKATTLGSAKRGLATLTGTGYPASTGATEEGPARPGLGEGDGGGTSGPP